MAEALVAAQDTYRTYKVAKTFRRRTSFHLLFRYTEYARVETPYIGYKANDEMLSQRQLEEEIKGAKDTGSIEEKCHAAKERLARSIKEFKEKFKDSPALG